MGERRWGWGEREGWVAVEVGAGECRRAVKTYRSAGVSIGSFGAGLVLSALRIQRPN